MCTGAAAVGLRRRAILSGLPGSGHPRRAVVAGARAAV